MTRHWVACSSNSGVGGIFSLSLSFFCFALLLARSSNHLKSPVPVRLSDPKAAVHVAVRPHALICIYKLWHTLID